VPQAVAEPGRVLGGRYRLIDLLARGGMATVWVAEDTLLARRVAVKTLHPELAVDEGLRTRFRNEAIAAARVGHPGIVATYDTGEDEGLAFIVMELVDGPNLRVLLDERGPLAPLEATRIARGVSIALDHAHRAGIVHRDVKPANVLVPPEGPVKVTDFGIAKGDMSADLTGTGTVLGTARYLAPEQVRGERTDARADVYACGLLLHEMLAGSLPFHGDTEMATALARLSVAPDPLPPGTPAPLATIVAGCLALDPASRYQSAGELADALAAVTAGEELPPLPAAAPAPRAAPTKAPAGRKGAARRPKATKPRRRRAAWPFAILGAAILGAGAGGGYLLVKDAVDAKDGNGANTVGTAPQVIGAIDFDPEGDETENPDAVSLAVDGDSGTAWATERYDSPDLGGLKSGVGLMIELAGPADITSLEVLTEGSGWSAEIYVGDGTAETIEGWGAPVATGEGLGESATFTIDPSRAGSAVLLWITRVPDGGRLDVSEVQVG